MLAIPSIVVDPVPEVQQKLEKHPTTTFST